MVEVWRLLDWRYAAGTCTRADPKARAHVLGIVVPANGIWIACPALGLWASYQLIVRGDYTVFGHPSP